MNKTNNLKSSKKHIESETNNEKQTGKIVIVGTGEWENGDYRGKQSSKLLA